MLYYCGKALGIAARVVLVGAAALLCLLYVAVSAVWTVTGVVLFGLLMIPWRLFRRNGRKNKQAIKRHEELIASLDC